MQYTYYDAHMCIIMIHACIICTHDVHLQTCEIIKESERCIAQANDLIIRQIPEMKVKILLFLIQWNL